MEKCQNTNKRTLLPKIKEFGIKLGSLSKEVQLKDCKGHIFPLLPEMVLFYDKRSKAFMSGLSLAETYYWHNGSKDSDDKIVFEEQLSLNDAINVAKIAANVAGLEVSSEDFGNVVIFKLRRPQ